MLKKAYREEAIGGGHTDPLSNERAGSGASLPAHNSRLGKTRGATGVYH